MQVVPTVTELVLRQVGVSSCCCLGCSSSVHPEECWFRSLGCLNGFRRSLRGIGTLFDESEGHASSALKSRSRRRRRNQSAEQDLERRAARAESLVELSAARLALEGLCGPGDDATLLALRDPERRPPVLRDPILEDILSTPRGSFQFGFRQIGQEHQKCSSRSRRWPIEDDRGPLTTFVGVGGRHNRFLPHVPRFCQG